jgi:hypothetical protein
MLPPPGFASPVPANRVPVEVMINAPIDWVFDVGQMEVKLAPLSVLFQTPPVAAAM